jgi:hypothetical protein
MKYIVLLVASAVSFGGIWLTRWQYFSPSSGSIPIVYRTNRITGATQVSFAGQDLRPITVEKPNEYGDFPTEIK